LAEVRCRPCNATSSIGEGALQPLQGTFGNWQKCVAGPVMLLPQLAKVRCRPCRALSGIGRGALQALQCTSGNSRNCPAEAATHLCQFTKPRCSGCNRPVKPGGGATREAGSRIAGVDRQLPGGGRRGGAGAGRQDPGAAALSAAPAPSCSPSFSERRGPGGGFGRRQPSGNPPSVPPFSKGGRGLLAGASAAARPYQTVLTSWADTGSAPTAEG